MDHHLEVLELHVLKHCSGGPAVKERVKPLLCNAVVFAIGIAIHSQ